MTETDAKVRGQTKKETHYFISLRIEIGHLPRFDDQMNLNDQYDFAFPLAALTQLRSRKMCRQKSPNLVGTN